MVVILDMDKGKVDITPIRVIKATQDTQIIKAIHIKAIQIKAIQVEVMVDNLIIQGTIKIKVIPDILKIIQMGNMGKINLVEIFII